MVVGVSEGDGVGDTPTTVTLRAVFFFELRTHTPHCSFFFMIFFFVH
jgi:hypothetical protein